MGITIEALQIGDSPSTWTAAGFDVDGDLCLIGGLRFRLLGPDAGRGIIGWSLGGLPDPSPREIDGIATSVAEVPAPPTSEPAETAHPNGVTHVDHLVLMTPDLPRTTTALAAIGLEPRRERDGELGGSPMRQVFFRLGTVILEVVGPPAPSVGPERDRPARLWGVTHVVGDLDASVRYLGKHAGSPKDAVQPGRRITTLRTRELGMSVRTALITPHVRRSRTDNP